MGKKVWFVDAVDLLKLILTGMSLCIDDASLNRAERVLTNPYASINDVPVTGS